MSSLRCFVSVQFQACLSRSITADSVQNRVPKAAAPLNTWCFVLIYPAARPQSRGCLSSRHTSGQSCRQGAMGSDGIAHPVGRKDGACAALPQHSTSTGCPTKRAQSILWGNAGQYLYSKDVHRPDIGSCPTPLEPGQQARPAGRCIAGLRLQLLDPHPGALACPPRQLHLLSVPAWPCFG